MTTVGVRELRQRASELLRRHASDGGNDGLVELLAEWERWSAEMLESHISNPLLCYFRSQHDNQSWLSAVTAILDTCAVLLSIVECSACRQARLTFAIARHTVGISAVSTEYLPA